MRLFSTRIPGVTSVMAQVTDSCAARGERVHGYRG